MKLPPNLSFYLGAYSGYFSFLILVIIILHICEPKLNQSVADDGIRYVLSLIE